MDDRRRFWQRCIVSPIAHPGPPRFRSPILDGHELHAHPDRTPLGITPTERSLACIFLRRYVVWCASPAACDYRAHFFETVVFFTDTLEFVFGTSDLLQSGWDMNEWRNRYGVHYHRFGEYLNRTATASQSCKPY
jgi:hypothetical protein